VYSFGRAALLLLVEVQNHTVPVRERRRIRDNIVRAMAIRRIRLTSHVVCIFKVYDTQIKATSSVKRKWAG